MWENTSRSVCFEEVASCSSKVCGAQGVHLCWLDAFHGGDDKDGSVRLGIIHHFDSANFSRSNGTLEQMNRGVTWLLCVLGEIPCLVMRGRWR